MGENVNEARLKALGGLRGGIEAIWKDIEEKKGGKGK